MIKVTKINGDSIVINIDLIETVRATPDTVVSLSTGKKILVEENVDIIVKKALQFKRKVHVSGFSVEKE